MTIECETITCVEYWSSYFINGDASGLDDDEKKLADAWLESIAPYYPVSVTDDEPWFTWHGELYGADCAGVNVVDYICYAHTES